MKKKTKLKNKNEVKKNSHGLFMDCLMVYLQDMLHITILDC